MKPEVTVAFKPVKLVCNKNFIPCVTYLETIIDST